jgi:hypothetical protein
VILVAFVREIILSRAALWLENIALRQQVAALKRERPWAMDSSALPAAPRALPMAGRPFQTPFPENSLPLSR